MLKVWHRWMRHGPMLKVWHRWICVCLGPMLKVWHRWIFVSHRSMLQVWHRWIFVCHRSMLKVWQRWIFVCHRSMLEVWHRWIFISHGSRLQVWHWWIFVSHGAMLKVWHGPVSDICHGNTSNIWHDLWPKLNIDQPQKSDVNLYLMFVRGLCPKSDLALYSLSEIDPSSKSDVDPFPIWHGSILKSDIVLCLMQSWACDMGHNQCNTG